MKEIIRAEKIYTGAAVLEDYVIVTEKSVIRSVEPYTGQETDKVFECISPGLFDAHINGGEKFHLTRDPNKDTLRDIEISSLKQGTVYTLPTLISSSMDNILTGIRAVREYRSLYPDTGILGLHLEGPFLNRLKRGAHLEQYLLEPTREAVEKIIEEGKDVIKLMTIAPELFSDDLLSLLIDSGINISAGHSNASYEQAEHAFSNGIRLVTHLYNAMSPFQHRSPGLIGAALGNREVYAPVIADGDHCHYAAVALAHKMKKDKLFLISDALFIDKKIEAFKWGEFDVLLQNGKYINTDGNLAGATISLADAVRNVVDHAGISVQEAVEMATIRPARALGLDNSYGLIAEGYPARFTVFDKKLENWSVC